MPVPLSTFLQQTIDKELPTLQALTDAQASESPRGGWTAKQELGHLIDSATNNHARFVLVTLQDNFKGAGYDQDGWVATHGYAELPWKTLVDFWYSYNSLLAQLVARIPEHRLDTLCQIGNSGPVTLRFVIEDYVFHMQHHIDQLLGRPVITQYPGATVAKHA